MQSRQHKNLSLLFILGLLVIFSPLAIDIYLPAFPTIAEQFNASEKQVQQTVAIFMLTVGLGQLIAGPLADKFGRKPVALAGVIIYGLAAFGAYLAPDFASLMVARALQGLGACATFVVAFAIVRDRFGSERSGQIITYLNGIVCFIPALAPILGAWLTVQFGWRMNFLFMAGFALIGLFITLLMYKETRPADSIYSGHLLDLRRFIPIISTPLFLFHSLICLVTMSAILVFVTLAPGWLITELGGSVSDFTFWFTCNAVLSIVASFIMPLYIKRQPKRALKAGLLLLVISGVLMLALNQQRTALALMFPMFIAAFGFALTLGSSAGRALSMFSKQAGTASALIGVMQMSGASLLVFLTQFLNLTTPSLIGVHFLLLIPFAYLLFRYKQLS
ncbi:Bcr/CflA family efflux MFS transporter [Pseudoalteromonas sp. MEBiC 03607]|jgi:DHA1 family bicyclomycin/chloramphenicol resistance-like MFS transporter|uniref:multidrug effflux MFS transporter n=1 Tax=Pseudoalteromonas TaxID=53246 RepID=UPI000ECC17C4|nr:MULTISPECIES: multidrug effflux MFS transporter [unclassified Pseudoalteromonas]HCV01604.1 Bcr/CflA family drug resistance efflux transporter [Pseudoalteromonas sp.]MCF2899862.1 multidrug effflux MFS transporter [Pseudoalteromonas sp. OFAV1]MCF2919724.1 multidrug effflux MFS transporter [Pseudoalteromonas sp. APAL1]TGV21079.1 Bcr/CflA family efflux MFS transporter [Pseudoalteromonas sp. MEBiC 03607]TMO40241.1 Bcr/CflA family drug resistance efflux transporter [Pseudoalteromonas sp. S4389]|tara:strand:+ start:1851 stop:3023 length:1173 start_codon:yes stop_codon:yes gene_type:complete